MDLMDINSSLYNNNYKILNSKNNYKNNKIHQVPNLIIKKINLWHLNKFNMITMEIIYKKINYRLILPHNFLTTCNNKIKMNSK